MPQFLLELFSEEIPARMQKRAAEDLKRMLMDGLTKAGLLPSGIETFSAPRRLAAVVEGLPLASKEVREERKGPKVGSPDGAIAGFLRGAGLSDISQARIVTDDKKGDFYVVDLVTPGQTTASVIAALVPDIIANFPWPKSMRWGEGSLRWVRPLHQILAIFDGEVVPFEVDGLVAGRQTQGHRFMGAREPLSVRDFEDYQAKLAANHVILDRDQRKAMIAADARTLCAARNLELVEDEGLLEEVCGLVDTPHVIIGDMDKAFLDLPPEVIRLTLRINQKYFVVRDPASGKLAPHFIVVSNVAASDGGKLIAQGNARVLAARLNDARYFWEQDRKVALEQRVAKLNTLMFHVKQGSVGDKVTRITRMAATLAPLLGADSKDVARAAFLCKADLTTEMVGEFPELQGIMGRYYARADGEADAVCDAIADHYKPVGPSDSVPPAPVSATIALADKLDTLQGFFAIGEKPTGSGDPYALRRAALGVIRIVRACAVTLPLHQIWAKDGATDDLVPFIRDRLRVALREEGFAPDVLEAAFAIADDDINRMCARVAALAAFLKSEEGRNLVAGYARAANILKAEEKKGPVAARQLDAGTSTSAALLPEEQALGAALQKVSVQVTQACAHSDFDTALNALASLRPQIDAFFEAVLVNDPDPAIRDRRLGLLAVLRDLALTLADLEKLAG
ncbi:MAG: hypothetical protein RLZZ157_891 [Pseudomonadota bacterium]|jgi:glycyl-tRNA synthetase beta chain